MRPPLPSEIAVDPDDIAIPSAYERARRTLRLGDLVHADPALRPIVNVVKKAQRDPNDVSERAMVQAVLYRKKYSDN